MSTPFRPRPDPRPEIEQALDRAIELSVGSRRYQITDGRLVYERHRRYRYTFTLSQGSWDLPDGTDLHLASADLTNPLSVELSHTKDDAVTITVTQRLTEKTLASTHLVVDRAFLLRRLKEAFLRESTSAQFGLKLLGVLDSSDGEAEALLVDTINGVFPADEAQRLALSRALGSELLMVVGPSGTGKTNVLAAIALLHATHFGYRVLIVSHTNIAVDNAVLRLAKFLRQQGKERFLDQQLLVRYGEPHLAELETDEYRTITLSLIVADRIARSREEVMRLKQRRESLLAQLTADREALPRMVLAWQQQETSLQRQRRRAERALSDVQAEERARLAKIMEQLTQRLEQRAQEEEMMKAAGINWEALTRKLRPLEQSYQEQWALYDAERKKLERLRKQRWFMRGVIQVWTGEQEKDLKQSVQTLAIPLQRLAQQIDALRQGQSRALSIYQQARRRWADLAPAIASWEQQRDARPASSLEQEIALTRQIADLTHQLEVGNPHIAEIEQAIAATEREVALLEEALAHLDQQLADAKREAARKVVQEAQVVAATLTSLYLNPHLLNQEWDVVIVDEGSMAPPPTVIVAGNRAKHHFVVIGDPLQLAPVCKFSSKEKLVRHWLGVDVYTHGHYTLDEAGAGTHHSVLLPYQSRMHTDICDLVRQSVYKGLLKDRDLKTWRPAFRQEPEFPVVLYNTGGEPLAVAQQPKKTGRSRYNEYHAGIAIALAKQVLADLPEERRKPEYIGIVTPYTAQCDFIKEQTQGTDLEVYCRVGTVHAYQGLEFDVLIFDIVESPGLVIAPFLREGWGSESMRLLNVAVTRARHKLFIVANMQYIRQQMPASSMLRKITELACQKRCIPAASLA